MDTNKVEVLLIGRRPDGHSRLSNLLAKRGCNCRLAVSYREAFRLLTNHRVDLVLAPTRLKGDSLYPLLNQLDGSGTTLFFYQPVEDGCWWLPALRYGRNCFGEPALRPGEFASVLDETIKDIRFSPFVATKGSESPAFRVTAP